MEEANQTAMSVTPPPVMSSLCRQSGLECRSKRRRCDDEESLRSGCSCCLDCTSNPSNDWCSCDWQGGSRVKGSKLGPFSAVNGKQRQLRARQPREAGINDNNRGLGATRGKMKVGGGCRWRRMKLRGRGRAGITGLTGKTPVGFGSLEFLSQFEDASGSFPYCNI